MVLYHYFWFNDKLWWTRIVSIICHHKFLFGIAIWFTKLSWPEDSGFFGRRVKLPLVCQTLSLFIAERQAGKLWIPSFKGFGLKWLETERRSTVSVADALSTRPLSFFYRCFLMTIWCTSPLPRENASWLEDPGQKYAKEKNRILGGKLAVFQCFVSNLTNTL